MKKQFDADRPLDSGAGDRLGFTPLAQRLADSLINQRSLDGFVIGIEGGWGSGKSTLINLTIEALRESSPETQIIKFAPWLIRNRDALVESLFKELDVAVSKMPIQEDLSKTHGELIPGVKLAKKLYRRYLGRRSSKERLRKSLRGFGRSVSFLSKYAEVVPVIGKPAANALEGGGAVVTGMGAVLTLAAQKAEIEKDLRELGHCIIVFIDDLDRLETAEAIEVLRLVRAVADFPNVIYVLTYDQNALAHTLEHSSVVSNGKAFLEKIIQASFRVPKPEAFDLRRWFREDVDQLLGHLKSSEFANAREANERCARIIDYEGGHFLRTPRDVGRALNALRLYAPSESRVLDTADLVWLQLLRVFDPILYDIVELYMTEAAVVGPYARVTPGEAEKLYSRIKHHLASGDRDLDSFMELFQLFVPGVVRAMEGTERWKILSNLSDEAFHPFIINCRFGSPQHYRLYTAFSNPAGSMPDVEVRGFLDSLEHSFDEASARFLLMVKSPRVQGGFEAEVLLDRLLAWADGISQPLIESLLAVLADNSDAAAEMIDVDQIDRIGVWGTGQRLFYKLFRRLSPNARSRVIERTFGQGRALGWLCDIMRDEIFAHGRYGERRQPEERWLLADDELDAVIGIMKSRFSAVPSEQLLKTPKFVSLLYGWWQANGEAQVREWVGKQIASDEGLIELLERMRSTVTSSHRGIYHPLTQRDVGHFMDYDAVTARVGALAADASVNESLRPRAIELVRALELDRDF